jgi:predicted dehydrogenase
MEKVKLGFIGVGNMGSAHLAHAASNPRIEIQAVCDINKSVADAKAAQFNSIAYYDSCEMFQKAGIDGVVIATPHYDHTPLTIAALKAGIHVLCEKPIAVHKADAEKMLEEYSKHPELKFSAMFNQRTRGIFRKVKELIENGELGKIIRVNWIITDWFRSQTYYDSGGWRATWKGEGGGVLLNQCPHQLDLFQWFFGLPSKVRAHGSLGKYHNIEVEDEITAYCEFPGGATGVFIASTAEAPGTNRLEITADNGRLIVENENIEFKRTEVPVTKYLKETPERFKIPDCWNINIPYSELPGQEHQRILSNFVDSILDNTPLIAPAVEGINSVELGNAMLFSALNDVTVEMPLNSEAYKKMLEKLIADSTFEKSKTKAIEDKDFMNSF